MDTVVFKSLEDTVVDIITEQEAKPQEGLTLDHIHKQLRNMNHPDCPVKPNPQAKLKNLLTEMLSLGSYKYEDSLAFYVFPEEMPVCDNLGAANDKLVEILHRLEDWIGPDRPWEKNPSKGSRSIEASELNLMRDEVLDALAFIEAARSA